MQCISPGRKTPKYIDQFSRNPWEQECIPVGCVPSAAMAISGGGGGGLSAQVGGCLPSGVSAQGGCVSLVGGGCIPACNEVDTVIKCWSGYSVGT